jgi:hypothetical protein
MKAACRYSWKVLAGAVLLSCLLGAANNLVNPHGVAWTGSPRVLPYDPEPGDSHWLGAWKGARYAFRELGKHGVPVGIGVAAAVALSLVWRRLRRPRWGVVVETWFRLGMAAIFLSACWYKLVDPSEFAMTTAQYRLLPGPLVHGFSIWMPAAELVVALGLLATRFTRELYLLLSVLWLMFIVALAQAIFRHLGIACGCFEIAGATSTAETWFSLLRDVVLIVPTVYYALRSENRFFWSAHGSTPAAATAGAT